MYIDVPSVVTWRGVATKREGVASFIPIKGRGGGGQKFNYAERGVGRRWFKPWILEVLAMLFGGGGGCAQVCMS